MKCAVALLALVGCVESLRMFEETRGTGRYAYVTMAMDMSLFSNETQALLGRNSVKNSVWRRKHQEQDEWRIPNKPSPRDLLATVNDNSHEGDAPPPGKRNYGMDGVLYIAEGLAKANAKYPLLVLTNMPVDPNKPDHPNIIRIPIEDKLILDRTCLVGSDYVATIQKIAMFGLTDYDKLFWLDVDFKVNDNKNPDDVFKLDLDGGVMGMRNDAFCDMTPNFVQPKVFVDLRNGTYLHENLYLKTDMHDMATSAILLEPSTEVLKGMQKRATEVEFCGTDQELIAGYYWSKDPKNVKFLPSEYALWGRCITIGSDRKWVNPPNFIHKPHGLGWGMPHKPAKWAARWEKKHGPGSPEWVREHGADSPEHAQL